MVEALADDQVCEEAGILPEADTSKGSADAFKGSGDKGSDDASKGAVPVALAGYSQLPEAASPEGSVSGAPYQASGSNAEPMVPTSTDPEAGASGETKGSWPGALTGRRQLATGDVGEA